jgi:hypothetical protein
MVLRVLIALLLRLQVLYVLHPEFFRPNFEYNNLKKTGKVKLICKRYEGKGAVEV